MAFIINPSKRFSENIRKTKIPLKNPGNVREGFFMSGVHESGIFQVENTPGAKVFDRCYVFSDVNYINQDRKEKNSVLVNLIRWLTYMSADFKITYANEYKNMKQVIDDLFCDINKNHYPVFSEGVRSWIDEKISEANLCDLDKVLYLTITVRAASYEEARSYFLGMDVELERFFLSFKSIIVSLRGEQRLNTLHQFFYKENLSENGGKVDFKIGDPLNDVIPTSIDQYKNYMVLNDDQYVSVLFARRFTSSLDEEKVIHRLTEVSYPSFLTIDYAPVDSETLMGKLKNASMNNERSITQEIEAKKRAGLLAAGISHTKEKRKNELEEYMDQIDETDESCLLVGLLVVVTAATEEELAARIEEIKRTGREVGVTLDTYNHVQLKAFNTALPTGIRQVSNMRAFLTSSVVALQPFYAKDLMESGGYFYGVNRTTKRLIFGNRKKLKSPHGMIVGHTGSGKSFLIKETEVVQTLLSTSDDLHYIDPQNEMEAVCTLFGGLFLDLTPKSDIHMNPMEIPQSIFKAQDESRRVQFVADVTEWASSFCCAIMQNIIFTQEHRTFVSRAVRYLYEKAFSQKKLDWQPTLPDLRDEIKRMEETSENDSDSAMLHKLYNSLEEYTQGSYDMFSHPSNVNMDSERFVVFGLRNVTQELWEPVMITIMFFLSNRMEYNGKLQKATRLIVDETQVVTNNKSSADMLLKAVITYRKFGGIVTLALQNLTRALENEDLRDMFSNCGYKCFLDQGGVDAQKLAEIQELSEKEFASLSEDIPGCGVMIWGKNVILFDAKMDKTNVLYDPFSTDFHEKSEKNYEKVWTEKQETDGE